MMENWHELFFNLGAVYSTGGPVWNWGYCPHFCFIFSLFYQSQWLSLPPSLWSISQTPNLRGLSELCNAEIFFGHKPDQAAFFPPHTSDRMIRTCRQYKSSYLTFILIILLGKVLLFSLCYRWCHVDSLEEGSKCSMEKYDCAPEF